MGESETVVVPTSAATGDVLNSCHPTDYADVNSVASDNAAMQTSVVPAEGSGDAVHVSFNSVAEKSHIDQTSTGQVVSVPSSEEMRPSIGNGGKETSIGGETTSTESNYATVHDASANGVAATLANGNLTSSHEVQAATSDQQFDDVLSAEEERLWSIVNTNSVDFNAWTSLIEETERVAQDTISKIRKVYDSFLVEFPLCYGYWKKYADHEARFGDINKVMEVYERAVQGVTYSVDIWLHYCMFTITTYGDPDTIRSNSLMYGGKGFWEFHLGI